jgi:peptidoglycan/LPS O-acetylase OafA/YrhL
MCLGWGWYLACEFQMFMFMPIFAFIWVKRRWIANVIAFGVILGCFIYSYCLAAMNHYTAMGIAAAPVSFYWLYYAAPWTRVAPYAWGVLCCIVYLEYKEGKHTAMNSMLKAIKGSVLAQLVLMTIGMFMMCYIMGVITPFLTSQNPWSTLQNASYVAASRWFFVAGLSLLLLPSLAGGARVITYIFGHPLLAAVAKISFSMYLVHFIFLDSETYGITRLPYTTPWTGFLHGLQQTVVTFLGALPLFLCVEMPCANLEGLLLPGRSRTPKRTIQDQATPA